MKTKNICRLFLQVWLLLFLGGVPAAAGTGSRPQWVAKGEGPLNERRTNDTYYFKVIQSVGNDLASIKQNSINALADYVGKENHIQGESVTELESSTQNGSLHDREHFRMTFRNAFSSSVFQAALVDDYWEAEHDALGRTEYHYFALYAVSSRADGQVHFDRFEVTRSYGAAPAVMSVIPGAGQLYKGQKLKGFCMLGGAVLGTAAIVLCENRRAYNETRIAEQPQFARTYSQRRDNWTTGRNVAIGATAALMLWSIIDAAATPGATRIRISPAAGLSLHPAVLPSPHGIDPAVSLALTF